MINERGVTAGHAADSPRRRGLSYDAIFFDLYGTLVDIRTDEESTAAWGALRAALAEYGVPYPGNASLRARFETLAEPIRAAAFAAHGAHAEPDLLPVFAGLMGCRDAALADLASRADAVLARFRECDDVICRDSQAAAQTSLEGNAAVRESRMDMARALAWTFRQASTSMLRLYPGALELLARLRSVGLRVVLVSNAQSCYTRPELAMLGLEYVFDRIVISSEIGVRKPSPAIFRRAAQAEGVAPLQGADGGQRRTFGHYGRGWRGHRWRLYAHRDLPDRRSANQPARRALADRPRLCWIIGILEYIAWLPSLRGVVAVGD
ncbi:HAD family hydrolase [Bifidobacterium breve]|uniref:HAD family hydrolase n=1 Tax=Bifidobacterium breve TaxID=1685 RepID=UPI0021538DCB|nr:HAD family hydrolase [Bifidobacterium breve]